MELLLISELDSSPFSH